MAASKAMPVNLVGGGRSSSEPLCRLIGEPLPFALCRSGDFFRIDLRGTDEYMGKEVSTSEKRARFMDDEGVIEGVTMGSTRSNRLGVLGDAMVCGKVVSVKLCGGVKR